MMKIISIRNGFTADHSSTSYEFLAIDRSLDADARADVAKLSRRAEPTERQVSFSYHMDGYDIPGGWESLMTQYYDVMVSESYDWWTFAIAFNALPEQREAVAQYAFRGAEDLGVDIAMTDDRVIVSIHAYLDSEALYNLPGRRRRGGGDPMEALLQVLSDIRQQLIAGDYRALYAVWEEYGYEEKAAEEDEEEWEAEPVPPEPPAREGGQDIVERLRGLLATP
jgi:hypothetical protein